jgi:Bacterial Ig-like domain (group 3)
VTISGGASTLYLSGNGEGVNRDYLTTISFSDEDGNEYQYVGFPLIFGDSGTVTTDTSISLATPTLTYGDEQAEKATVSVSTPNGLNEPAPEGTVTIVGGNGAGSATTCTASLVAGTATCALPATEFPPGSGQLQATYNGDAIFGSSTSALDSFSVHQADTTTSLSLSAPSVAYGDEQSERVSAKVSPQYGGTPAGTVTISSGGTAVCVITLSNGSGSCALSARVLPLGTHALSATYGGNSEFTESASPAVSLSVRPESTTTTLSLAAPSVTYGDEQAESVSVSVVSPDGGTPTGTVTIQSGSTTVCTITLSVGGGSCSLPAASLRAGTARLNALYGGSADFASSTSIAASLAVARAASKTILTLSATKLVYGKEDDRLTVVVSPQHSGTPAGKVTIKAGATTICTMSLSSKGQATCTISSTKLKPGKYGLVASYATTTDFVGSTSAKKPLAVVK